jgi:hypothetical protein
MISFCLTRPREGSPYFRESLHVWSRHLRRHQGIEFTIHQHGGKVRAFGDRFNSDLGR